MDVADFDFTLPDELIAQEPAAKRGGSRLLILNRATGAVEHTTFSSIKDHLETGDVLVVNNTKVFPARLLGRRVPSGGAVEALLLVAGSESGEWEALVHPGQKLKPGARVVFEADGVSIHAISSNGTSSDPNIRCGGNGSDVGHAIDRGAKSDAAVHKREDRASVAIATDSLRGARGSVAAPTAGHLHARSADARTPAASNERSELTLATAPSSVSRRARRGSRG